MPAYIGAADVVGKPLKHKWDDAEPDNHFRQDERIANAIGRLSDRAMLVFAAGTAEWIAWRMSEATDVDVLQNAIDAIFAASVDWRYVQPMRTGPNAPKRQDNVGSVLGPPFEAFFLLDRVATKGKKPSYFGYEASMLTKLATLIISSPKPFKAWHTAVLERLFEAHPADPNDRLGALVPREALDPAKSYDPKSAPKLVAQFLASLDPGKNPFLSTPEQLKAAGFESTPYKL